MITKELVAPRSIVVVGASNNISKPGGKLLKNLIDNHYKGELMVVNPNESEVQGIPSFPGTEDLPQVEMAVLAIPAQACLHAVEVLATKKGTKGFIIISAGISINYLSNPFGGVINLSPALSSLLLIFWLVWCTNTVGWAAGIEGQLPGFVSIAAIFIGKIGRASCRERV